MDHITIIGAMKTLLTACLAVIGWFTMNFVGKPILAFRDIRREALEAGERYAFVSLTSSDGLRSKAVKALAEVANTLRGYNREHSAAIRAWCRLCHYDLDIAVRALFGLAHGARGEFAFNKEAQRDALNSLFVALGAAQHLSAAEIERVKAQIVQVRSASNDDS